MTSYRQQGLLAFCTGAMALAACGTPDLATGLRPEGDPEVLSVVVQTDQPSPNGGAVTEAATYCKADDAKAPTVVGLPDFSVLTICPDVGSGMFPVPEVENADPMAWLARVQFDELLNPDIETLVNGSGGPCGPTDDGCIGHLNTTLPFDIECGGTPLAYDGYYVPNGNNVSWPVGPNLTVFPTDYSAIATGAECSITIKDNVVDKDGNKVPTDQRGPFKFKTSPLAIIGTDPPPCDDPTDPATCADEGVDETFTPTITFNAFIDAASVDAGDFTLVDAAAAPVAFTVASDGANNLVVTPTDPLGFADGSYTLTIPDGAMFSDVQGGSMTVSGDIVMTFIVTHS